MTQVRNACVVAACITMLMAIWRPTEATELLAGLEGRLLDLRYAVRGPLEPSGSVVVLAIDDVTLERLGGFPLSRAALAKVIDGIGPSNPAVVAFDLLLTGMREGDEQLARAFKSIPAPVLAISLTDKGPPPSDALLNDMRRSAYSVVVGKPPRGPGSVMAPLPEFSKLTALGHVNIPLDAGGNLRRVPMAMGYSDQLLLPALPVTVARELAGLKRSDVFLDTSSKLHLGQRRVPLDRQGTAILNFLGPKGTIPTFSLSDAGRVDLEGKAIFVGATAQGYGDRFATPYARDLPGVEALATMTENLLSGRVLRRDAVTWLFDIFLATAASLACALITSRRSIVVALLGGSLAWLIWLFVLQVGFHFDLWLDAITTSSGLVAGSLGGLVARQRILTQRSANLARYKSPQIVEALANEAQPKFDGRLQHAAALFVDAAGFTKLSQQLGPQGTSDFLKAFHAGIERAANACSGTVEQFAGDGAMLIFGLPDPTPEDAANALKCADLLFQEIAVLCDDFSAANQGDMSIRIGAHYGEVVAAIVGGAKHSHVTITGTVVNAASRLQEVAKAEGVEMVVSADLLHAAGGTSCNGFHALGATELRGLDQPLEVWARARRKITLVTDLDPIQ